MFNRSVGIMVSIIVILVMLFTSGFDYKDLSPAPLNEPTRVPTPVGQEDLVFINPGGDLNNNARYYPTFTITESWNISIILTIHWNDGNGVTPGEISLKKDDGMIYGPWQATGNAYKEVENVRWVVEPDQTLPPGEYTVIDSDPDTWSNNELSEYVGFTRVSGFRMNYEDNTPIGKQPEVPATEPEKPAAESSNKSPAEEPELPVDENIPNQPEEHLPSQAPLPLKVTAQTSFTADGKSYKDKTGVIAAAPKGTVADGKTLKMVASQPAEDFDAFLNEIGLIRKSSFYKVEVNGIADSLPDAVLSFPTSNPGDRIARLVEGSGLIWADDWQETGKRNVKAFIGINEAITSQYVLLGPVEGASASLNNSPGLQQPDLAETRKNSAHLSDLISKKERPEATNFENCSILMNDDRFPKDANEYHIRVSSCRRDKVNHIQISTNEIAFTEWDANLDKVDALISKLAAIKKTYGSIGFEKALPEANRTLSVVVQKELESPSYGQYSGNLYFGWKDVLSTTSTSKTEQIIAHELFHWIEHGSYTMRYPFIAESTIWWLEISAEVATFMINPENPQLELAFYGTNSNNGAGHKLGFQETPFEWMRKSENARYIHALQYYLMMNRITKSEAACLPDELTFIETINKGYKPFTDRGWMELRRIYRTGSSYLARYLLNEPDPSACAEMKTGGMLVNGRGYGDYIHASSYRPIGDRKGLLRSSDNSVISNNGVATVSAAIAGGGVYPLRVSNGADIPFVDTENLAGWAKPSVPYILTIKPSVPFFYKIGDNPVQWHDGKTALVISPITSVNPAVVYEADASGKLVKQEKAGIPSVRIVAYNETETEAVFQATYEPAAPVLVLDPTSLSDVAQNPDQVLNARLENLLTIVTSPVKFKFEKVMTDGWSEEIASTEMAARDGVAEVSVSYKFENPDLKEVRVSATYILENKEVTVSGVIPVGSSPGFKYVKFDFRASGAEENVDYTIPWYVCPIKWVSQKSFEYDPALGACKGTGLVSQGEDWVTESGEFFDDSKISLKGEISPANQVSLEFNDPQGNGVVNCNNQISVINIPFTPSNATSEYNQYLLKSPDNSSPADSLAHVKNFMGNKYSEGFYDLNSGATVSRASCSGLPEGVNSIYVRIRFVNQWDYERNP